jgi:glucosyl-dolichyl phosphate glucuronosyltransferase
MAVGSILPASWKNANINVGSGVPPKIPGTLCMTAELRITTAICTWNRSKSLRVTLTSLQQLTIPPGIDWEVLIVNNNCTDDTDEVIEESAGRLPILLLHEKRQGHSHARNCAVTAAKGDYILWTDDDVIVDAYWLVAYVNAIRTWPKAALFGGPIKLKLEGNPPPWLLEMLHEERLASVYAQRDLSSAPVKLNWENGIIPWGANLCIRMREQQNFRYKPQLGRYRNQQIRGEETDVVRTMLESGAEGWWVPDAIVHHVITQDLQTRAHLRRYFIGLGRSYVREIPKDPKPILASLFHALRLLLSAIKWELRFQISRLGKPPKIWFEDLRAASIKWGQLFETWRISPEI